MAQEQMSGESVEPATRAAVERFNEAFNRHDATALAALLTEDTIDSRPHYLGPHPDVAESSLTSVAAMMLFTAS